MVTKIYKVGAEWCGPCRMLKEELKDFDLVPIIEIDADEDETFCEKYTRHLLRKMSINVKIERKKRRISQ